MPTIPFPADLTWYLGVIAAVAVFVVIKWFLNVVF